MGERGGSQLVRRVSEGTWLEGRTRITTAFHFHSSRGRRREARSIGRGEKREIQLQARWGGGLIDVVVCVGGFGGSGGGLSGSISRAE